jgi:hypothetical protein
MDQPGYMNSNSNRRPLLSVLAVFSLLAVSHSSTFADPPPWAGNPHNDHDDDDDDDDWWKHHDKDEWKHHHHKHHKDGDEAYREDERCADIRDRIHFDRSKIHEIEPTGRHRKALQWYKDDLGNAKKDLDRCHGGG